MVLWVSQCCRREIHLRVCVSACVCVCVLVARAGTHARTPVPARQVSHALLHSSYLYCLVCVAVGGGVLSNSGSEG